MSAPPAVATRKRKPRKPRRATNKQKQARKSCAAVNRQQELRIAKLERDATVSLDAQDYSALEHMTNPFGNEHGINFSTGAVPPNPALDKVSTLSMTANQSFSGGTSSYVAIEAFWPDSTARNIIQTAYGTDTASATSLANGSLTVCKENNYIATGVYLASTFTPLVMALKVNITNSTGQTAADIHGGTPFSHFRTAAATYDIWGNVVNACPSYREGGQGMTVKSLYRPTVQPTIPPEFYYTLTPTVSHPMIYVTGLSATDTVSIRATVTLIALVASPNAWPYPIHTVMPSQHWNEFWVPHLDAMRIDSVADGHSFKSFINKLAKAGKWSVQVGRKTFKVLTSPEVIETARFAAQIASAVF